jgi:thiol:disulfide interchange protein
VKKLPRPGRWMETTKQALAFPLLLTVIWLIWVFGQQTGVEGVILLCVSVLCAAAGVWAWGRWPNSGRALGAALLFLALSAGVAREGSHRSPQPQSGGSVAAVEWESFSPARLKQLRAEGKTVFVDFTAAWCVTCKVNERLVFGSREVQQRFRELGVVTLKADWTQRDPEITRTLARYGRSGVPLYLIFKPNRTEPQVLPEIVTPGIVLDSLSRKD